MLAWSESLRLGVSEIDAEHIEIFRVCGRLNDAVSDGEDAAADDLTFLRRYLDDHFAHEEQLMQESRYPSVAEHAQEHAKYRAALSRLLARPTDSGLLEEIALSVTNWLLFHIQHQDRALAAHLRGPGPAAQGR